MSTENKEMKVPHQYDDDTIERVCQPRLIGDDVGMLLDHFNNTHPAHLLLFRSVFVSFP